jgi:thioredoxin 1
MKTIIAIILVLICSICFSFKTGGDIQSFSDQTFQKDIKKGVVVVDFWATWCGPCKMQAPIFESVAEELKKDASFGKVDVDKNKLLSDVYGINSIPTIIIFKDGQLAWRLEGLTNRETLLATIKEIKAKK